VINTSPLTTRDRRALMLLGGALVIVGVYYFGFPDASPTSTTVSANPELLQQRVARLRQLAATVPARDASMKEAGALLADREKGILQGDTAPQAQASLLEIARRVGKLSQLDIRGGEFGAPRAFGDYGLVYATINFDCHVEQLVNFLADLGKQPELIAPFEQHINSGNVKDKTVSVRMVLAGIVAKKLIPEKKGLGAL
jgi:hypothetical protein